MTVKMEKKDNVHAGNEESFTSDAEMIFPSKSKKCDAPDNMNTIVFT